MEEAHTKSETSETTLIFGCQGPFSFTLTDSVARIRTNDQALFACRAEAAEASAIKETG